MPVSTSSNTQTEQLAVECRYISEGLGSRDVSIAWWIAVILLIGVSIVAIVGGLIIKYMTDNLIRRQ